MQSGILYLSGSMAAGIRTSHISPAKHPHKNKSKKVKHYFLLVQIVSLLVRPPSYSSAAASQYTFNFYNKKGKIQ
jgi:hypothetical protein